MYVVAEEKPDEENESGNIIVLSNRWLTPRKAESFWPNSKLTKHYNKLLQNHVEPQEDWSLITLKRKFFETDDLILARRKAKEAEITSDLTDGEVRQKRKIRKTVISSSDEEDPFQHHKSLNKKNIFENQECDNNNHIEHVSTPAPLPLIEFTQNSPRVPSPRNSQNQTSTSGFEYNTTKILNTLLEQNNQILSWIRLQNEKDNFKSIRTPIQIPITFPIKDEAEIQEIEKYLEDDKNFADLCEYFRAFESHTVTGTVNKILRHTVSNSVATKFNYRGKRGKKPFEALNLKISIIRAVKKVFKLETDQQIEDDIKNWLKHAPQRTKLEEKKVLARLNNTV